MNKIVKYIGFVTLLATVIFTSGCGSKGSNLVQIEYRSDKVDVSNSIFEYQNTSKSSFVDGAWYDSSNSYMIIKLNSKYYHYCGLPSNAWNAFTSASSYGTYYNSNIKGSYDCRNGYVPDYNNETGEDNISENNETVFDYEFDHTIPLAFGGSDFKSTTEEAVQEEMESYPSYNDSYVPCFYTAIEEETKILTANGYIRQDDGSWVDDNGENPDLILEGEIEDRVTNIFNNCVE
jgi:hypothetical protein